VPGPKGEQPDRCGRSPRKQTSCRKFSTSVYRRGGANSTVIRGRMIHASLAHAK
jgi:hypothetical protein